MFQTEINLALQALGSKPLTDFMKLVTASGYYWFISALVMAVMLGLSLRKGFLLLQVMVWTGIVTEIVKLVFGLPRPFFADSRVMCLEDGRNISTGFRALGGQGFWDLPSRQVIDAYRLLRESFGFPSGHSSSAMMMWGGLAVLFRSRLLGWLSPLLISLVAFSRLYLGVHFLADIFGGLLLGGILLYSFHRLLRQPERQKHFFSTLARPAVASLPVLLALAIMFIVPLVLVVFSLASPVIVGYYVGLNAAFMLRLRRGLPADDGTGWARAARVLLGGLFFFLIQAGLQLGLDRLKAPVDSHWLRFLVAFATCFLSFWGGLMLFERLGLYRHKKPAGEQS